MSGGFFRGTSADQDTRFSNKQAKLLKSQKFPPELDQLVDMRKVQMEVMKPWIATRVTELLGFEDEVLINFIFGLLDAKEVDGKQIQIQLTGFMEKNTAKFMRELWGLLLSAQQNASGVPQQFLDAKAEEIIKKKAESDRIVQEIQRKREKEAKEQQLLDQLKRKDQKPMTHNTDDNRGSESKHGSESRERRYRKSGFDDHSPSNRKSPPAGRSRSISPPRKDGRARSRSSSPKRASRSPLLRRSISPVRRRYRSPRRSPPRRRSPYYPRRRSPSPSRRRRSPHPRRRSPELAPRRSPSPPARRRRSPSLPERRPLSPSPLPPPPPRRSSPRRKRNSSSPDQSGSPSYQSRVNSRDMEQRSPDQHTNGRARAERAYAKRKGPDSIAVDVRDKTSPQSSPENSPARPAHSKSPRRSAYRDPSPVYKRHRLENISESPVRHAGKQLHPRDSPDDSVEEEPPSRSRGRALTRRHMYGPSVSPEEREYVTKQRARDAFSPDDIASSQRHQSGKQSIRETYHSPDRIKKEAQRRKHSNEKNYESEEELKYGPDPDPVKLEQKRSNSGSDDDDMEKQGRSRDKEKRRHKKSRKHRKYSDESSESESFEESEKESMRRKRREEKRRLKREEKRQRREEKHREKHKSAATPLSDVEIDADMRDGSEEEPELEKQKRLEIELKERALQSFRAKKSAATH